MSSNENTIHVAIELSTSLWLVGTRLPGAAKCRMHRMEAGDTAALLTLLGELRTRLAKAADHDADLVCCFEAGRCRSAWKIGSDAHLVVLGLCVADHAGLQQIELPASIHLAFDELELGDLPLGLTVRPG